LAAAENYLKKKKELNKTIKTSGNTCYLLKKKTEFTAL
jgi:hypothetical protein